MDVCWLISQQLKEIWRPNLVQEKVQSKCYHTASILTTPLDHVRDHTPVYDHTLMSYLPKSGRFLLPESYCFLCNTST